MRFPWARAVSVFLILASLTTAGSARAQLLFNSSASGSAYAYGNLSMAYASCTINTTATGGAKNCSSGHNSNVELVGVAQSRSGTTLEIESTSGTGSNIFDGSTASQYLQFNLSITPASGSLGLSAIQATVAGGPANNSGVFATVSEVSGNAFTTFTSSLSTNSLSGSFTLIPVGSAETIQIMVGVQPGSTLSLNNVRLLLTPAPEPATLALFGIGLAGLTAARRRRRQHPRSSLHQRIA